MASIKDGTVLGKEMVKRAATKTPNLVVGAVAVAASAALLNLLPLVLFGIGEAVYLLFRAQDQKLANEILRERQDVKVKRVSENRESLYRRVHALFTQYPFTEWVGRGVLPNYLEIYDGVNDKRERVARIIHDRADLNATMESDILRQLDHLQTAFLKFVQARIAHLQVLTGVRVDERRLTPSPVAIERPGRLRKALDFFTEPSESEPVYRVTEEREAVRPRQTNRGAANPFDIDARLAEFDAKIAELEMRAKRQPSVATILEERIEKVLKPRKQLLIDCRERDARVTEQLDALPEVFELILERVSIAEFSASEITGHMGAVVAQVEETERFVEEMRPMMDDLSLDGLTT